MKLILCSVSYSLHILTAICHCGNALIAVTVKKQSVLPVRPQVEVVPSLSKRTRSGRKIVLQFENIDVIASIAKT